MKIIHYCFGIPPVHLGGTPRYVLDLSKIQAELGNEVGLLIPGPIHRKKRNEIKIKKWKKQEGVLYYQVINSNYVTNAFGIREPMKFMSSVSEGVYLRWLEEVKPDVIHIHSVLGIHLEFLEAAREKEIPVIFSVHDFFGICPKIDLLKNGINCHELNWKECKECCKNAYSLPRLRIIQSDFYRICCSSSLLMKISMSKWMINLKKRIPNNTKLENESVYMDSDMLEYERLREYYLKIFSYVDFYHYNSRQTKDVIEKRIGKRQGIVLPVMHHGISDNREEKSFNRTLKIGYLGSTSYFKGYEFLLHELDKLYETGRTNFQLDTYMNMEIREREYVRNHGTFSRDGQAKVYGNMDLLVVPSICRETFGFVVYEALSYGVPVVVSENVGAAMLIDESPGIGRIFRLEEGALEKELRDIYDNRGLLVELNKSILKSRMDFNYMRHVEKIIDIYKRVSEE